MSKNNYFNYVNPDKHYYFLYYLLSFAMDKYKDEDPLLSDCAKELIRYILEMKETEDVIVTEFNDYTFTVNHTKYIGINTTLPMLTSKKDFAESKNTDKEYYFVCYAPSSSFDMRKLDGLHIIHLSMKKLKEICSKYPSKNEILKQHMQYIDEQECIIQRTLQMPMRQWKSYEKFSQVFISYLQVFISHLVEDSIVDVSKGICSGCDYYAGPWEEQTFAYGLHWYYISDNELRNMGVHNYIEKMDLFINDAKIIICFQYSNRNDDKTKKCKKEIEDFVNNIYPVPITFDLSDYKEKIQYAQRIMDRLKTEFKLSLDDETNSEE